MFPLILGALALGGAGYYGYTHGWFSLGPANAPFTTLMLMSTVQSITAPRGKLIAVQAPAGGTVVTATPGPGFSGRAQVTGGTGYIAAATSGVVVVAWRAPDGTPVQTAVSVVAT